MCQNKTIYDDMHSVRVCLIANRVGVGVSDVINAELSRVNIIGFSDLGVLLSFMFLVNVLGAIFLLPALAAWFNLGRPLVRQRVRQPAVAQGQFRLKNSPASRDIQ